MFFLILYITILSLLIAIYLLIVFIAKKFKKIKENKKIKEEQQKNIQKEQNTNTTPLIRNKKPKQVKKGCNSYMMKEILNITYKLIIGLILNLIIFSSLTANMILGHFNIALCIILAVTFITIYILQIITITKQYKNKDNQQ